MSFGQQLLVIGSVFAVLLAAACTRDDGANLSADDPDAGAPDGVLDATASDVAVDAELPLGAPGSLCYLPIQGGHLYRCPPGFEDCIPFQTGVSPHPGSFCVKKVIVGDGEPCNDTQGPPPADFVYHMCDAGLVCDGAQRVCHPPATPDAGP